VSTVTNAINSPEIQDLRDGDSSRLRATTAATTQLGLTGALPTLATVAAGAAQVLTPVNNESPIQASLTPPPAERKLWSDEDDELAYKETKVPHPNEQPTIQALQKEEPPLEQATNSSNKAGSSLIRQSSHTTSPVGDTTNSVPEVKAQEHASQTLAPSSSTTCQDDPLSGGTVTVEDKESTILLWILFRKIITNYRREPETPCFVGPRGISNLLQIPLYDLKDFKTLRSYIHLLATIPLI